MIEVFFSYSHRDEEYRNELETHLAMLKRQGIVSTWHDRRIGAGQDIDATIMDKLESADVILLLVSPYFLASDYCYDREMERALARHQAGEACVIPVIVHPCDWHTAPFGKLLATPTDGKPISKHSNLHDAYLDITQSIRAAVARLGGGDRPSPPPSRPERTASRGGPRSSNLRVRREWSDHERAEFRDATFEYIANYFENSMHELKERNLGIDCRFRRIDAETFTASVYSSGRQMTACRVVVGSQLGDIAYSSSESPQPNSCNEWLTIEHDGYSAIVKPGGLLMHAKSGDGLTQEGAAEYLWSAFIEPVQRR